MVVCLRRGFDGEQREPARQVPHSVVRPFTDDFDQTDPRQLPDGTARRLFPDECKFRAAADGQRECLALLV